MFCKDLILDFFNVLIIKWKFFEIVYYIWMRFSFCHISHYYYITKMFSLDNITNEKNKENNKKWLYIPDHPYKILVIGVSGSGKTIALPIYKIYLYAKDMSEPKYQFLIKKRENIDLNDLKAFIQCSNTMNDIYSNIDEYKPKQRKILIVFDGMIADIE